jgi:hypothetical protein
LEAGLEIELPSGHGFHDKDDQHRDKARVKWWDSSANTYRKAAILGRATREALPDTPIPEAALLGYGGDVPVFFGHYWWSGIPEPLLPNVACVDYSAGKGGPLVPSRDRGRTRLASQGQPQSRIDVGYARDLRRQPHRPVP